MTEAFKLLFPLPVEQQKELFANCSESANQVKDVQQYDGRMNIKKCLYIPKEVAERLLDDTEGRKPND